MGDRIASFSERLDAEHERFKSELRRDSWRHVLLAVLGAMLIFGGGVTGFLHATRYRGVNHGRHTRVVPPPEAVVVVINPH